RCEFCGLLCCHPTKGVIATEPHEGPTRSKQRSPISGEIEYIGEALCWPGFDEKRQKKVECPRGTTLVGAYHSHPWGSESHRFSEEDDNLVKSGKFERLYLCSADAPEIVKVWDRRKGVLGETIVHQPTKPNQGRE